MSSISKSILAVASISIVMLAGCATSTKIQVVQPGDNKLSCSDLTVELAKLNTAQADIDSKKGATGTNVAAALFWLPGLAYTYYDAGEAQKLISERRSVLTGFSNNKNCPR
jgi:hypothetical protein